MGTLKGVDAPKSGGVHDFAKKMARFGTPLLAFSLASLLYFPTNCLADPATTPGQLTISPQHQQLIITATYSGDEDGSNALWVDWDENDGDWSTLLGSTLLTHTESPYTYSITGLTNGAQYRVRLRWQDDNSPDDQEQTGLIPYTPVVHNSLSTASSKWDGSWGVKDGQYGEFVCATCHKRGSANIKRIKEIFTTADGSNWSGPADPSVNVSFQDTRDDSSDFGDDSEGHSASSRICEVCHSLNKYHNYKVTDNTGGNTGHYNRSDCIRCHKHNNGFKHGGDCEACHGHDAGYEYSLGQLSAGVGSTHSHSTHTENDADDQKGPHIGCDVCHDTSRFAEKIFADGKTLEQTIVCDACHSPSGSYDGVYNAVVGAKANWDTGVYNGAQLQAGKEKWCVTCHDDVPADSQADGSGVSARNVDGDNTNFGFYSSGHGVNANIDCTACHDITKRHIDHIYYPVDDVLLLGNNQTDYRFYDGAGMIMPTGSYTPAAFVLCYQCHQEGLISTDLPVGATTGTNFREQSGSWGGVNLHRYHVIDGLSTSCLKCHNVHGSQRTRMTDPAPEGNGDFRPLRYDSGSSRYFELADQALLNDPAHNVGGSIVTNPVCGGCHNAVSLGSGLTLPNDEGWYLREYDPQSYQDDTDFDGDGVAQEVDNCPGTANSSQADDDGDGIGNECDNCKVADTEKSFNPLQTDTDQDGLGDSCDDICYGLISGWGTQFGPLDSEATDVAVDSDGNSFIVGYTTSVIELGYTSQGNGDMFIARYDAHGNRTWIRQFGSAGIDRANAVAIDAENSAYVVGRTSGTLDGPINSSGNDAFILKYNTEGILQWVEQLHSSYDETAHDVTVDAADNVYVTGTTGGDLDGDGDESHHGDDDIFVSSYNSAGVQNWFKQLGTSSKDYGYSIAVDPSAVVYKILVAGDTLGDLDGPGSHIGSTDYFIASLSADDGTLDELSQHGTNNYETINALAVSGAGDIFVGGRDYSLGGTTGIFLTKLNKSRIIQWKRAFGSLGNDYSRAVAVDNDGNSYIAGEYGSEIALRKYDPDGLLRYSNRWGRANTDMGGIAMDGLERIYLAGTTSGPLFNNPANGKDALLFRLDQALCPDGADNDADGDGIPNGWDNCPYTPNAGQEDDDSDGLGDNCDTCLNDSLNDQDSDGLCDATDDPCLNDPVNDPDGYNVCANDDNCPLDANSDQFDSDGDGWGDVCDNSPDDDNPDQKDSDFDGIGDISDVCPDDPDNDFDGDGICVGARYLYTEKDGANDNCPLIANGAAEDNQADTDLDGIGDACEQACSDYSVNWKSQFGTPIRDDIQAIATVENNGTVVVGKTNGDLNSGGFDFHLTRVGADGSRSWSRQLGSADDKVYPYAVAVAADGHIYVGGETQGDIDADGDQVYAGAKDGFLAKFDSTGGLLWLRQFGTNTDDLVTGIAIDSNGDIYLSGATNEDLDGAGAQLHLGETDLFLIKYEPDGTRTWLRQHGTSRSEGASDIAIHDLSIYLSSTVSIYGLDGQDMYGWDDAILLKYDSDGTRQWTRQIGTEN